MNNGRIWRQGLDESRETKADQLSALRACKTMTSPVDGPLLATYTRQLVDWFSDPQYLIGVKPFRYHLGMTRGPFNLYTIYFG